MLPIAHIASALLVNRIAGLDDDPMPSIAGALVPDALDKTLSWVLGATPSARYIGHTPLLAAGAALVAAPIVGRRRAAAFGVAYIAHLVGDLWEHGHVPWLMPLKHYEEKGERWQLHITPGSALLELLGAAYIAFLAKHGRAASRSDDLASLGQVE
ncbi:MAG: metal-dependent hydrolase [Dehalococcoidia bacterium]